MSGHGSNSAPADNEELRAENGTPLGITQAALLEMVVSCAQTIHARGPLAESDMARTAAHAQEEGNALLIQRMAEGIALLAFLPGGVSLFGIHFQMRGDVLQMVTFSPDFKAELHFIKAHDEGTEQPAQGGTS